jgi:hypothetical protein
VIFEISKLLFELMFELKTKDESLILVEFEELKQELNKNIK